MIQQELKRLSSLENDPDLKDVNFERLREDVHSLLYEGASHKEIQQAFVMAARQYTEEDHAYSLLAARIVDGQLMDDLKNRGINTLEDGITEGIMAGVLDPLLSGFDLSTLNQVLDHSRTKKLDVLGVTTLLDRYLMKNRNDEVIESVQAFFMRVAMGLAINETDPNAWACQFYHVLSNLDYMASTPTLFNSGSTHPQLSSCYLTTIGDSLGDIYGAFAENAELSKWSGGLGNDWTRVRALGAKIKGTNGASQGVVPFLNVQNASCVAVNQGGKRKGAACAYLEAWHADVEEFLELRKNTGDDRRRTHDMNTALWVPDEFMRRVFANEPWYLFSPDETPDLHETFGLDFKARYEAYVELGKQGKLRIFREIPAVSLWRKALSMLFETGHPWITFKDACNIRSPQQHVGVVHSSNLCTEITLNTSDTETAVCNLGSINLANHVTPEGEIDYEKLKATVSVAVRMLDNVIDINFYPSEKAQNSNLAHRPIGLGVMGFQDMLYKLGVPYAHEGSIKIASDVQSAIGCAAIKSSALLAAERGSYSSYQGSLWSRGHFPQDTACTLMETRHADYVRSDIPEHEDWAETRALVAKHGMRNSNVMAIAPTATISNICGVSQSIEPTFENLFVKSNLSGEFTIINKHLVAALKKEGLWNKDMIRALKVHDGSVQNIPGMPEYIKEMFKTAFEHDMIHLIKVNAGRQYWIDQSVSLNIYLAKPDGKLLDAIYKSAFEHGLKTTYYLRSKGATSTEKATVSDGALNAVAVAANKTPRACSIDNPDCEACQ